MGMGWCGPSLGSACKECPGRTAEAEVDILGCSEQRCLGGQLEPRWAWPGGFWGTIGMGHPVGVTGAEAGVS